MRKIPKGDGYLFIKWLKELKRRFMECSDEEY